MSIRNLQVRFATVGAIRLGAQRQTSTGRMAPSKLDSFRITVRDKTLAEEIAQLYGGEVQIWRPKQGNPGYEIFTTAVELPVYVPRQSIDPNYELWGPGVLQRRCDGETEQIRNVPCMCAEDARRVCESRKLMFDEDTWRTNPDLNRNTCKPTTRLSVILAEVSVTGQFKLESHGWNAATELSVWAPIVQMATSPLPAKIVLEKREKKTISFANGREKIETRNFSVPVLDFGDLKLTGHQAFGGGAVAIEAASRKASAIAAGVDPQNAIASAGGSARTSDNWITLIELCDTLDELENLRDSIKSAGVSDRSVISAWKARHREISTPTDSTSPVEARTQAPTERAPEPAIIVEEVSAELEPDAEEMWTAILNAATKKGMKLAQVVEIYKNVMGHDPRSEEANGYKYQQFLDGFK